VSNRGVTGDRQFKNPGIVRIRCNKHSDMRAELIVVGTPYWVEAAADGTWRIDAPAGPWKIVASDIDGARFELPVPGCVTNLDLPMPRPPVDRQRSKNGDVGGQYDVVNN
jgi:hypothetical protein